MSNLLLDGDEVHARRRPKLKNESFWGENVKAELKLGLRFFTHYYFCFSRPAFPEKKKKSEKEISWIIPLRNTQLFLFPLKGAFSSKC